MYPSIVPTDSTPLWRGGGRDLPAPWCIDHRLLRRALRQGLEAAGVAYVPADPTRARDFARAAGFLTKTDAVDARMLAAMGAPLRPRQGDLQAPGAQRADKPAGDGSIAGPPGDSTAGMASGRV